MENDVSLDQYASQTATAIESIDSSQIGGDVHLTLEQIITKNGEVVSNFHLVLASGSATVHAGPADAPDITIKQDADTADAIRSGALHAQGAFLTGRLSIDGDVDKLIEHSALLSSLLSGKSQA